MCYNSVTYFVLVIHKFQTVESQVVICADHYLMFMKQQIFFADNYICMFLAIYLTIDLDTAYYRRQI